MEKNIKYRLQESATGSIFISFLLYFVLRDGLNFTRFWSFIGSVFCFFFWYAIFSMRVEG